MDRALEAMGGSGKTRATIGEVRACPQARQLLSELMEEVLAVAPARGIQLGEDVITRTLAFVESPLAGRHRCNATSLTGDGPNSKRSSVL